jgi:DUF1365 family protein
MHSALYVGSIRHRRFAVKPHAFRHGIAMAYLDLDEVGTLLGGRLTRRLPGLVRFRRGDYLGDPTTPLADAVRAVVAEQRGSAPAGPVRLLTHLRTFGHCFNPVSFYYCFDAAGERVEAIVAEVTSTPWGERHAYVLEGGDELAKRLHVSPFMGMDQRYRFRAPPPAEALSVRIESSEGGARVFDATLAMRRRPLTRRTLAAVTARYPAATVRMLVLIYSHALVLKLKGVPVQPHPKAQRT